MIKKKKKKKKENRQFILFWLLVLACLELLKNFSCIIVCLSVCCWGEKGLCPENAHSVLFFNLLCVWILMYLAEPWQTPYITPFKSDHATKQKKRKEKETLKQRHLIDAWLKNSAENMARRVKNGDGYWFWESIAYQQGHALGSAQCKSIQQLLLTILHRLCVCACVSEWVSEWVSESAYMRACV